VVVQDLAHYHLLPLLPVVQMPVALLLEVQMLVAQQSVVQMLVAGEERL